MAISIELKVTTEALRTKADEVSNDIEAMKTDVTRMAAQIYETSKYWKGDAGDLQRKQFNELIDEMNLLYERLKTYPTRLLVMAGLYEEAEENNIITGSKTKPDVELPN